MGEMIKMVVVLTILSVISGGSLSYLENELKPLQDKQIMEKVKGPAVRDLLAEATNDPVADHFKYTDDTKEKTAFVGKLEDGSEVLVLESGGNGYGGPINIIVGINVEKDVLNGIRVTTHTETAGLGANAKDDPSFAAQFKGKPLETPIQVTNDGGNISAIGGATITSRAVCAAATKAIETYKAQKQQLLEEMKSVIQ